MRLWIGCDRVIWEPHPLLSKEREPEYREKEYDPEFYLICDSQFIRVRWRSLYLFLAVHDYGLSVIRRLAHWQQQKLVENKSY
jgi:hypothetical protein